MRHIIAYTVVMFFSVNALAVSYESYDEIVDRLSSYNSSHSRYRTVQGYSSESVHAALGIAQSFYRIKSPAVPDDSITQGGLMLAIGTDVFSKLWQAEGLFRNLGSKALRGGGSLNLTEFEFKVLHRPWMKHLWQLKVGAGIGARYLSVKGRSAAVKAAAQKANPNTKPQATKILDFSETTPSFVGTIGIDARLTRVFSIGAELNVRQSLIEASVDRFGADLGLRIDAHF